MTRKTVLFMIAAAVVVATTFGNSHLRAATASPKGYVIAEITVTDPEAYKQQLETEAEDIIDAWHAAKSSLPRTLRDVLFAQAFAYGVDVLKESLKSAQHI